MKASYIVAGSITVVPLDGSSPFVVPKDHISHADIYSLVAQYLGGMSAGTDPEDPFDEILELFDAKPRIQRAVAGVLKYLPEDAAIPQGVEIDYDGNLTVDGKPCDKFVSDLIFECAADKKNMVCYLAFIRRMRANHDEKAIADTLKFVKHLGIRITMHGTFLADKGVYATEDPNVFESCHDRSFKYVLGEVAEIPRDKCDPNWRNACSSGLHVGTPEFASTWGDTQLEMEVDPVDVVAVPSEDNRKMRVCKVLPLRVSLRSCPPTKRFEVDGGSGKLGELGTTPNAMDYDDDDDDDDDIDCCDDCGEYLEACTCDDDDEFDADGRPVDEELGRQEQGQNVVNALTAVGEVKAHEASVAVSSPKAENVQQVPKKRAGGGRNPKTTWVKVGAGRVALDRDRKVSHPGEGWVSLADFKSGNF
jgi:hypothetical protein